MDKNTFLNQYDIFILKAKQDISLVHEVIGNDNVAPEIMLFHIQQCVEKLCSHINLYVLQRRMI